MENVINHTALKAAPEHLLFARQFADEIMGRFTLIEQNEIIKAIVNGLREQRLAQIAQGEERIECIKQSLSDL